MYYRNKLTKRVMEVNDSVEGEPIEAKVRRILHSKEPITDGAPIIHTDRKDGVLAAYDIRADRMDIAIEAADAAAKAKAAKRDSKAKVIDMKDQKKDDGKPESTNGTGGEKTT